MCRSALKGSERIFQPPLNPPSSPLSSSSSTPGSSRRGGRSVRKNAALSSKAHRHSSPPVHRAKRRISVFHPLPARRTPRSPPPPTSLSLRRPADPSAGKMDAAAGKSDGGVRVTRGGGFCLATAFHGTPINGCSSAKFDFFLPEK